jgi:hypothetical protein
MDEQNKITTVVELNAQQAAQELVKLNATVSNTTKTLEERIEAKNKAIEIQNQLSKKTINALENERRTLEGRGASERELQAIFEKLNKAKLDALKVSEKSKTDLEKLTVANDKLKRKLLEEQAAIRAAEEATTDLNSSFEEVYGNLKPLMTRLGEAEDRLYELALAGQEATDEYKQLLEVVSSYKRTQQETDRVVDAASTTLTQRLAGAAQLAATGIQTVTSGLALVGVEGETVEKTLLKVQAAMSFADSVKSLSEMGGQFTAFKTTIVNGYLALMAAKNADTVATEASIVAENQSIASKIKSAVASTALTVATNIVTAAQWLWNAAVLANPLVALAVAVTALVAGLALLTMSLIESSEANEQASKDTEKLSKELDKESIALYKTGQAVRDKNKQTLAMAKANGESSESIRKLQKKLIEEQIATDKASTITARNTFIQERNNLAKLEAAGASDEVIAARKKEVQVAYELFKRENKQLSDSYKERAQLRKDQEVEIATERTEARKKAAEDAKKSAEDARKAAADAAKKALEDRKSFEAAREKFEKEQFDKLKREKAAQIALEELDISDKKKRDPEADTLSQEKDLLKQKMDYELMTADLLESEKLAIKTKYAQLENDLITKTEQDKQVRLYELGLIDLEKKQELSKLDFENKSRTILEQNAFEVAQLQERTAFELQNANLTKSEQIRLKKETDAEIDKMNKAATIANKNAVDQQAEDGIGALAESFGVAKEVAVAKAIMNAPEAISNSFKMASSAYAPPLSIAMGALGAAATVVPIIKGLADIKKVRFPGKKGGGSSSASNTSGSIQAPSAGSSVPSVSIGDLAANNAAQLGIDTSIKSAATSDASNNILGSSGQQVVFSEGKYSDFKKQVEFKESKTSI